MAKRSGLLIGPGTGLKARTGHAGRITLRGVREDERVIVRRFLQDRHHDQVLEASGDHPMDHCEFVQVTYEGKNKAFIACVIMGE